MPAPVVLIAGASDLGTACALRLIRAGLKVVLLEKNNPVDLYHSRCFSSAVFAGKKIIEQITATTLSYFLTDISEKADGSILQFIKYQIENRQIPLILEPDLKTLQNFQFDFLVVASDEIYQNNKNNFNSVSKVIGFKSQDDPPQFDYTICKSGVHASRVKYPFLENEYAAEEAKKSKPKFEIIKAPIEGVFEAQKRLNDNVSEKEILGNIAGIPILSPAAGRVTGVLNSGIIIPAHQPFIEIDTKVPYHNGMIIRSDSFCLAGGVLEAIFYDLNLN